MRLLSLTIILAVAADAGAFEPTKRYAVRECQGFKVLLGPDMVAHKKEADEVCRMIDVQLSRLARVIPEKALKTLQPVRIWVEWDSPVEKGIVARYFQGNPAKPFGLNPDKTDTVEIPNAARFVKAYQDGMEWAVTHELAHAYHHQALGRKDAAIKAAHKQAVERKLYDDVEHFNGVRARGYAVTNHWEYFATLSESYFGKSFNFPYNRDGLTRYDTTGYWLMKSCWDGVE